MDSEEIKKDLKKILDLTTEPDSEEYDEDSHEPCPIHCKDAVAVVKHKEIPSAHAIMYEQELRKSYRESMRGQIDSIVGQDNENRTDDPVEEEEPLEKFTNVIMAVTQHDEYNENDDDEKAYSSAGNDSKSIKDENISAEENEEDPGVPSVNSQLDEFTDLVMAVTQHDAYNEEDDEDFIKAHSLPREDSETTLKAVSNVNFENVNAEADEENIEKDHAKFDEEKMELRLDLTNAEEFNSKNQTHADERKAQEVELEVELQVKVKSDTDLDAIAEAVSTHIFAALNYLNILFEN